MTRLETERLLLRPLELYDAPTIQKLAGDPLVAATTLNIPHPYPIGAAVDWIRRVQQYDGHQHMTFGIVQRQKHDLLGTISLHAGPASSAEMGYWLGVPYWNQGYMTEAVQRIIRYGFEQLGLHRVVACHFTINPASGRVMVKAGMIYEGVMRQHVRKGDQFFDLACYSILRSESSAADRPL
jgi:RimJ/RimL family protein N-acetyltransferase